ncbi:hypothetical protein COMA1_60110 [Candidatus Nitrospira nitrosa]|uniref:Uncharacterized protein n=1 Tax=Candidatus Nitrospira nitrosa TaxID=1742972 RepID=A0A0S4LPH9_9BACT|nr:hypothetical protein COMA1_60110 [Candidatus Nitrospira nitrosa]
MSLGEQGMIKVVDGKAERCFLTGGGGRAIFQGSAIGFRSRTSSLTKGTEHEPD